jgi:hypothetical protein
MDPQKHLARQLRFLENSCSLYDEGAHDEAIRIATVARVLFHHTHDPISQRRGSRSLLSLLGATKIRLLSTCTKPEDRGRFPGYNDRISTWQRNLTEIAISFDPGTLEMVPKLGDAADAKMIRFPTWWDRQIVYAFTFNGQRISLHRRDLICIAANQDGGAHVDPQLDHKYQALECGGHMSMGSGAARIPLANAHLAALRQIGYEILHSPELTALL